MIAAFDVVSGEVQGSVGESRTEADSVAYLEALFATGEAEHFDTPEATTMLRILRSEKFRNEFRSIGGYDIGDMGSVIAET